MIDWRDTYTKKSRAWREGPVRCVSNNIRDMEGHMEEMEHSNATEGMYFGMGQVERRKRGR